MLKGQKSLGGGRVGWGRDSQIYEGDKGVLGCQQGRGRGDFCKNAMTECGLACQQSQTKPKIFFFGFWRKVNHLRLEQTKINQTASTFRTGEWGRGWVTYCKSGKSAGTINLPDWECPWADCCTYLVKYKVKMVSPSRPTTWKDKTIMLNWK